MILNIISFYTKIYHQIIVYNNKYCIYNFIIFILKKIWYKRFLPKAITVYFKEKEELYY